MSIRDCGAWSPCRRRYISSAMVRPHIHRLSHLFGNSVSSHRGARSLGARRHIACIAYWSRTLVPCSHRRDRPRARADVLSILEAHRASPSIVRDPRVSADMQHSDSRLRRRVIHRIFVQKTVRVPRVHHVHPCGADSTDQPR
jgi:hypothetical protein